jgi:hypothetical protein
MSRQALPFWSMLLLGGVAAVAADKAEPPVSKEQIQQWIRDLDHDKFATREEATRKLARAGKWAIEPVADAAIGSSLETTGRAIRILKELASTPDAAGAEAARAALAKIAASDHARAAWRARSALRSFQREAVLRLKKEGATFQNESGRVRYVSLDGVKDLPNVLPLLRNLPDLEEVSLSTPLMTDAGLAELKGLPRLKHLNLWRSVISDAGLKYLKDLPRLSWVPMGNTKVTDAGLIHLKGLTRLEYVGLRGNQVTDAGLVHLQRLTNLTGLYLGETKVTDKGLVHLKGLTRLETLRLDTTAVTDAGLEHLKGLSALRYLSLWDTKVTETGAARLKQAIPGLRIDLKRR